MSLETLLEAARYVELQEAQRLQHSGDQLARAEESREPSPLLSTNGSRFHDLITSPDFQKRAAGTREVHNKLEKNRRAHLKECFELLKKQLPPSSEEKKSSNLSILQIALRFINTLRRKERDFEHEMERLAREKIAFQQRLTVLKKDLSAQWEHIDFDKLLPDSHLLHDDPRNRDNISHTTSTASEMDDTMSEHGREEPLSKCGVLYSSTSSLSSAATACSPPQLLNAHAAPTPLGALTSNHTKSVSIQPGIQISSMGIKTGTMLHAATHAPVLMNALHANTVEIQATPAPEMEGTKTMSVSQQHVQMPMSAHVVSQSAVATTLVSPTIQLLTPAGIRVLPGDTQSLGLTIAHRLRDPADIRTTTGSLGIPTLQLTNKMVGVSNGALRTAKHQPITLTGVPSGLLSSAGMTLTPIGNHNMVTPVTVVSQGNQVAHILTTGGKVLKGMTMPSLVNGQYLVKPVTVVVSAASSLPQSSNANA